MRNYSINIEIPEGRLTKIFNKLDRAQEVIRKCYYELEALGVVKFTEASSQTPDNLCFTGNKLEDDDLYDMLLNIRFLEKKTKAENIDITDQALTYIVSHVGNNRYELEGALSRVVAYSELIGENITSDLVANALKDADIEGCD